MSENKIDRIGIFAGGGVLPRKFAVSMEQRGITPYIIAIKDNASEELGHSPEVLWTRLATVGKMIKFLQENKVDKMVLVGAIKRPSFTSMIPDTAGIKLLNNIRKLKDAGDTSMFSVIIDFIESHGISLIGVDEAVPELVAQKGAIGKISPTKSELNDIEYGTYIATEIGKLDIGQAVIVQNKHTLGVEGADGTDELITRCAHLQHDGKGAMLVKMKKPKQDRRVDLPSIGPLTIERLHQKGYRGVVVDGGNSLIIDKEESIAKANEFGLFIYGA